MKRTMILQLLTVVVLAHGAEVASPSRARVVPSAERTIAPSFTLPDASGRQRGVSQLKGKVVLLGFWATWCGGCKDELPWFADFSRAFQRRGFEVVAVSMDDGGWPAVNAYTAGHQMPGAVLLDDGTSTARFRIGAMPVAVLIDRQGRVAAQYVGLVDREDMERNIELLLAER